MILRKPKPRGTAKNAKTASQCFLTFIDDEMINIIVTCTNTYPDHVKSSFQRDRDTRPTEDCERKGFTGILYPLGVERAGRKNVLDLWAMNGTGIEQIYLTMGYNRFRILCHCTRFDNIHDRDERRKIDKVAPIREIFERFANHCKSTSVSGSYLTVDEQLMAFIKGDVPFGKTCQTNLPNMASRFFCWLMQIQ